MTGDPTPAPAPLRLLVVDDHEVVREGLVALLARRDEFQVVAEAGSVAESIAAARRFQPDLVVMDVRLPDGSGIEACREIRAEFPAIRVVMLTSYPDEEAVLSAILAGASGYLLKQIRGRDLVSALESVGRGDSLLDPAVTERVLERVRRIANGETRTSSRAHRAGLKILRLVAEARRTRRSRRRSSSRTRAPELCQRRLSSSTSSAGHRPRPSSPSTGSARTSPSSSRSAPGGYPGSRSAASGHTRARDPGRRGSARPPR